MNNNELYHYGVPGMKWGVRRAQKQLASLTGRDRSKVSAEEAIKFKSDVKTASNIKNQAVREQWIKNSVAKNAAGKKYAEAVIQKSKHAKAKKFAKGAAITAGVAAAYPFLGALAVGVNQGIAPIAAPVARALGTGVKKTLFWWTQLGD